VTPPRPISPRARRAAVLAVAPLLVACGGGSKGGGGGGTQSGQALPAPVAPSVTVVVSASPSPVPATGSAGARGTPGAPATPGTPSAAAPPSAAGVGLVVDGTGTTLTGPAAPTNRGLAGKVGNDCYGLVDGGFSENSCAQLGGAKVAAVLVVETKRNGSGTEERDLLYTVKGDTGALALRRVRQVAGARYDASGTATAADLDGDGVSNAAVLTTPSAAASGAVSGTPLETLDVVTSGGAVSLHRDLHGGVARQAFGGKGLELFTPRPDGRVDHGTFQLKADRWTLILSEVVSTDKVPTQGLL